MDRDMGALVRAVVKDMQWNRPVEKIAKRQGVSEEVVEQILEKLLSGWPGNSCLEKLEQI